MNRILLFIFLILSTISLNAQLKTVIINGAKSESLKPISDISQYYAPTLKSAKSASFNAPLQKLNNTSIHKPLKVISRDKNGQPIFIKGTLESYDRDLARQTLAYLKEVSHYFGIESPNTEWSISKSVIDDLGMEHIWIKQTFSGIPVYAGELILHAKHGKIESLTGKGFPTPEINSLVPALSKTEAERKIIAVLQHRDEYEELSADLIQTFKIEPIKSKLIIYHTDGNARNEKLAYHIEIVSGFINHKSFFIDAHNGDILHEREEICKFHNHPAPPNGPTTSNAVDLNGVTRTINTYEDGAEFYLLDASRSMWSMNLPEALNDNQGVIWTLDAANKYPNNESFKVNLLASSNNTWNNPNAVSAHYNAGVAYEYYKNVHGRESINGEKGNIISIINVSDEDGNNFDNAFWAFDAMWYGNGDEVFRELAASLDVAAHEMTHGVIQSEANLEYFGESGALNESFADVFAVLMDRDNYTIGEDIVLPNTIPSGALRDLSDPHNGGSQFFDGSFQPKHVDEQYFGNDNNGGVHINSGIPNHAFFLFAETIGKDKAEKIYYRALTTYLTRSSQFIDLRIAIEQSAGDLFGTAEVNAAKAAFDAVGILTGSGGNYQTDVEANPGNDFLVFTDDMKDNLYIVNNELEFVFNPATEMDPFSRPSITDDGSILVFVNTDKQIQALFINWTENTIAEQIIQDQPIWNNVVISKDGNRIAAIEDAESNKIQVFDFSLSEWYSDSNGNFGFELYNPTYTQGVNAGIVKFADAMEFDITGEILLYDALSELTGADGQPVEFWDIGFLNVFDNTKANWADGNIQKLFSQLGDGISIGNPTFSKNSPYIIAFDFLEEQEFAILGVNYETGDIKQIFENTSPGYPSYNSDDTQLVFTNEGIFWIDVGILSLGSDKISTIPNTEGILVESAQWGVAFSDGNRQLYTGLQDISLNNLELKIFPNPASSMLSFEINSPVSDKAIIEILSSNGMAIYRQGIDILSGLNFGTIPIHDYPNGNYLLKITGKNISKSLIFNKN